MTASKISAAQTEKPSFSVGDVNATHINLSNVATLLGSHRYVPYGYDQGCQHSEKIGEPQDFGFHKPISCT